MKYKYPILFSVFLLVLASCKEEKFSIVKEELIELYGVTEVDGKSQSDQLKFKEAYFYDSENRIIEHHFFNLDGSLSFLEKLAYNDEGTLLGSKYYDHRDSLLSFYKHEVDTLGRKSETRAFDAASNELLRIEEYTYDSRGHLASKTTLTPDLQIVRKQLIDNDINGNDIKVTILDENEDIIFEESYQITSANEKEEWLEKWGFVNNTINSYRKRSFKRY